MLLCSEIHAICSYACNLLLTPNRCIIIFMAFVIALVHLNVNVYPRATSDESMKLCFHVVITTINGAFFLNQRYIRTT